MVEKKERKKLRPSRGFRKFIRKQKTLNRRNYFGDEREQKLAELKKSLTQNLQLKIKNQKDNRIKKVE